MRPAPREVEDLSKRRRLPQLCCLSISSRRFVTPLLSKRLVIYDRKQSGKHFTRVTNS